MASWFNCSTSYQHEKAKTANRNWFLLRVCFTLCWIWENHWKTRIKSTSKTFPIRYRTKGHRSKRGVVVLVQCFSHNSETPKLIRVNFCDRRRSQKRVILAGCCSFWLLFSKWFWLLCCLAGLALVSVDAHETNATQTTLPTSFIANRSRRPPYLRPPSLPLPLALAAAPSFNFNWLLLLRFQWKLLQPAFGCGLCLG